MENKFKNYNLINLDNDEKFIDIDKNNDISEIIINEYESFDDMEDSDKSEFDVSIIKNNEFENKVNLTFNLTIKCNNILNKVYSVDLDINNSTYDKIINDLCIDNL
jgi:hypothetical protein